MANIVEKKFIENFLNNHSNSSQLSRKFLVKGIVN